VGTFLNLNLKRLKREAKFAFASLDNNPMQGNQEQPSLLASNAIRARLTSLQLPAIPQFPGAATEEFTSEDKANVIIPTPRADIRTSVRSTFEKCKSNFCGLLSLSSQNEDEDGNDGLCQPKVRTGNQISNEVKQSSRLVNRLERDGIEDSNLNENLNCVILTADEETAVRQIGTQVSRQFISNNDVRDMNLVVKIQQLEWYNHPHFLPEERYAIELKQAYCVFQDIQGRAEFEFFLKKAVAIICKMEKLVNHVGGEESKEDPSASTCTQDERNALYAEIEFSISKLVSIEQQAYTAYASVLQKWCDVCSARTGQGFNCTSISLGKRRQEDTIIHDECSIVINQLFDSLDRMSIWIRDMLVGGQGTDDKVKTFVQLVEGVNSSRSSRLHLVLTSEKYDTGSGIMRNTRELRRRQLIETDSYVAKLIMNGRLVGSTSAQNIDWKSWTVSFNHTFQCTMMRIPSSCCIQLFQRSFGGILPDTYICSIFVSFPGCNGKSCGDPSLVSILAPKKGMYHFQSSDLVNNMDGVLEVETMWIEVPPNPNRIGQPDYPMVDTSYEKHHLQGTITRLSSITNTNFSRASTMALNDDSMSFRMSGTRHSYLNPHRFQEPVRHHLIRQREMSGSNRTSVPLSEADNSQDTIKCIIADRKTRYRYDDVSTDSGERLCTFNNTLLAFAKPLCNRI
jgi:hypothetical protein